MNKKKLFSRIGIVALIIVLVLVIIQMVNNSGDKSANVQEMPDELYLTELDAVDSPADDEVDPEGEEVEPLTLINNRRQAIEYENGIRAAAGTEIVYDLSEYDYNFLMTEVGVDRNLSAVNASLIFEIYGDDELKYTSRPMNRMTPREYSTTDISDVELLRLVIKGPEATEDDFGGFGNIKLLRENPITRNIEEIKEYDGMKLIFNEEFEEDKLDSEKWVPRPWPENGTHHYANEIGEGENIWVEDGNLVLQAKPYEGNLNFETTSGHVITSGQFEYRYGRIDVRAKIPTEAGMWPAIWMMPSGGDYEWPMDGEIDIMELISQEPDKLYSTIHSGVYQTNNYFSTGSTYTINDGTFFDDYHIYSFEWEPNLMRFLVNDEVITEITNWNNWYRDRANNIIERPFPAPFDQEYYIKLNLATGGWSKGIDEHTRFGERTTMLVDYVRVYQDIAPSYSYKDDEPFAHGKQGAVWYAQRGNDGVWENYDAYDSETGTWTMSIPVDDEGNEIEQEAELDYVALNAVSPNFAEDSYDASAISFRAPYGGYVKVSLADGIELANDSEVTLNITTGDDLTTNSDILKTETITADLSSIDTYLEVEPDQFIRFEILKTDNEVKNLAPIVEYLTEEEYNDQK